MLGEDGRKRARKEPATLLSRLAMIDAAGNSHSQHLDQISRRPDFARIGGDESKLRKHYGLSREELASAERISTRPPSSTFKRGAMAMTPAESVEDLRKFQSTPSTVSDGKSQTSSTFFGQQDYSSSPRRRDTRKFSIRKVFGKSDHDANESRDSMVLPIDCTKHNIAYALQGTVTKHEMLPSSRRRLSVESRRHPPALPSLPYYPMEDQSGDIRNAASFRSANSATALQRPSSIKKGHHPGDASSWDAEKGSQSMKASSMRRPLSSSTGQYSSFQDDILGSIDETSGYGLPFDSCAPVRESTATNSMALDEPILPSYRPQSANSGSNSDEKRTLRAHSVIRHSHHDQEPIPSLPCLDWPMQAYQPSSLGDWTSATTSRQTMEAVSFFARLAELETRMATVERSLAGSDMQVMTEDHIRELPQEEKAPLKTDLDPPTFGHFHGQPYMQSLLTPPTSQVSENRGPVNETWLDGNSSVSSSYADSISASSPWLSSRTSAEVSNSKRSPPLPSMSSFSSEKRPEPASTTSQSAVALGKMRASTVPSALAQEIEAMRCEMASLRSAATQPSSAFGRLPTPKFAHTSYDDTNSIPFNTLHEDDDENELTFPQLPASTIPPSMKQEKRSALPELRSSKIELPTKEQKKAWRRSMPVSIGSRVSAFA